MPWWEDLSQHCDIKKSKEKGFDIHLWKLFPKYIKYMNSCPEKCWPVNMKWKIALFDQPSLSPTSWIVKLTPNSSCCWNYLFQMLIVTVWNLSSHGIFGHTAENNFVYFNRRSELLILCNYFFSSRTREKQKDFFARIKLSQLLSCLHDGTNAFKMDTFHTLPGKSF